MTDHRGDLVDRPRRPLPVPSTAPRFDPIRTLIDLSKEREVVADGKKIEPFTITPAGRGNE